MYYTKNEDRKQCVVTFRITDEEKQALDGLAKAAGCSKSDLLRGWIAAAVKKIARKKKG